MDSSNARGSVELRGVTKRFGEAVAVDDIDVHVRSGEFMSLLGPSGCGKTTTLRIVSGLERPTEGHVWISGSDATEVPAYKRNVNTVFQSYALFPHLTVADNIAYGLKVRKQDRSTIKGRVARALEMVRLPDVADRHPTQLSGGQQQRVALARALVNEPDVLLLDEPLSALDLKLREAMRLELKHLHERLQMTFIFVTHDQREAITMSDRVAVMNGGKVLQVGTPEEVYERPTSRFVASFIGETNLLKGSVEAFGDGGADVRLDGGALIRAEGPGQTLDVGSVVTVTVRPERVRFHTGDAPTPNGGDLGGVLTELVYLGDATRCAIALDDGSELVALAHNGDETPPFQDVRPGEAVRVWWHHGAARIVMG